MQTLVTEMNVSMYCTQIAPSHYIGQVLSGIQFIQHKKFNIYTNN